MNNEVFEDWRNRYSRLFMADEKWWIYVDSDDGNVHRRRWHWWNPAHLVRHVIHQLWVRKYW